MLKKICWYRNAERMQINNENSKTRENVIYIFIKEYALSIKQDRQLNNQIINKSIINNINKEEIVPGVTTDNQNF
jgi:hypothetical protein